MDSDTLWHHIDHERAALSDLLAGLDERQWRTPSLCAGWSVRDVAVHLAFAQSRLHDVLWPALRSGFRFNAMIRDSARRSPLSEHEAVAVLRGFVGSRRRAPFVSEKEPLIDILVHTQDICVPLGLVRPIPPDAGVVALERTLHLNHTPFRLRRPLDDVRLVATDTDWAQGEGPTVEGPLVWLLLLAAGREAARSHLAGALDAA